MPGSCSCAKRPKRTAFSTRRVKTVLASLSILLLILVFRTNDTLDHGTAMAAGNAYLGEVMEPRVYSEGERRNLLKRISRKSDSLLKMTGEDLLATLDAPELVRAELPTVVWQYRSVSCVLDVYLASMYEDAAHAPVVHYEMRARTKDVKDGEVKKDCIGSLVNSGAAAVVAQVPENTTIVYNN